MTFFISSLLKFIEFDETRNFVQTFVSSSRLYQALIRVRIKRVHLWSSDGEMLASWYWSPAVFLNVHLTPGSSNISLLLYPLSFSTPWLIRPTLSHPPTLCIPFSYITFFPNVLSSKLHFIHLPNLLELPWCLWVSSVRSQTTTFTTLLLEIKKNRTNEAKFVRLVSNGSVTAADSRAPARPPRAAGIDAIHFCRIWNLFFRTNCSVN